LRHHLVRWEEEYADQGLFIIEVDQSIGAPREIMRCMVESRNLKHPVLWDDQCRNTRAYGISAWPFAYLIGVDGKVFWEGNPARWICRAEDAAGMRILVEGKLKEVGKAK
jgi:hypothetical protein